MTASEAKRRVPRERPRLGRKLASLPGVATVRRPVGGGSSGEFPLTYVRTGPRGGPTVLVLPGGPGLGSVLPYRSLRATAAARGLDVLMVEHRGVGLSRRDLDGSDLPDAALTVEQVVDDVAAVLDAEGVDKVMVYGTSYGTYLAQGFGLSHPDRIVGMVLDSPMLGVADKELVRSNMRGLLWNGDHPETSRAAALLRTLVTTEVLDTCEISLRVQVVYEFAGPGPLERLLALLADGRARGLWHWLGHLGATETGAGLRYLTEFDRAGVIAFSQLGYRPNPDGHPLEPDLTFLDEHEEFPPFTGEPYDLPHHLPEFTWPTVVISGERDLRTPRPIAEHAVELLPHGFLVPLAGVGHSALDTHPLGAVTIAGLTARGAHQQLPALGERLARLPCTGSSGQLARLITTRLAIERLLPFRKCVGTCTS